MMVNGYSLNAMDLNMEGMEQVFAVKPDNTILTCIRKYSTLFNEKDDKWFEIPFLPYDAEFIGKYIFKEVK